MLKKHIGGIFIFFENVSHRSFCKSSSVKWRIHHKLPIAEIRKDSFLYPSIEDIIKILNDSNITFFLCEELFEEPSIGIGESICFNISFRFELVQCPDDRLNRINSLRYMEQIGIDSIRFESIQAWLKLAFYTFRRDIIVTSIFINRKTKFCDESYIFSDTFECFSEKEFTLSIPIDWRRIEWTNSEWVSVFEKLDNLWFTDIMKRRKSTDLPTAKYELFFLHKESVKKSSFFTRRNILFFLRFWDITFRISCEKCFHGFFS